MAILGWIMRIIGWLLATIGTIVVILSFFVDDTTMTLYSYLLLGFDFTWWEAVICAGVGYAIKEWGEMYTED